MTDYQLGESLMYTLLAVLVVLLGLGISIKK